MTFLYNSYHLKVLAYIFVLVWYAHRPLCGGRKGAVVAVLVVVALVARTQFDLRLELEEERWL